MNTNRADFLELSQEILDHGALLRFRARGTSMHPFIGHGDILVVESINGTPVNIGDVVLYRRSDDSLTVHRLVKVNDPVTLITKGDSLHYYDAPFPIEQVMGRVIRIEGHGKQLPLDGWLGRTFSWLIAWLARGRYPNQMRLRRNLGRLWWVIGGRRMT